MPLQIIIFSPFLSLFFPSFAHLEEARERHITVYGAVMTDGALPETTVLTANLDRDFKFAAVTAGKKIGNLFDRIDFELEGRIVKHIVGRHHWEFNALVVARWLRFPWNDIIKTSFAVGEGLSRLRKHRCSRKNTTAKKRTHS